MARAHLLLLLVMMASAGVAGAAPRIMGVQSTPAGAVGQFGLLQIAFQVATSAARPQWPYDPAPPAGIPAGAGITVNAIFTNPQGVEFTQPAFFAEEFVDEIREGRDWHLPTGNHSWKVRFTPNTAGQWRYRIVATDASGSAASGTYTFDVTASSKKGFVKVSKEDPRYFEFDDGSPFHGAGFEYYEFPDILGNPETREAAKLATLNGYGVNFVRIWISSIFGSAWPNWIGGRNQYRGYLPYSGLTPFYDATTGQTTLTLRIDYELEGDAGWFDACRHEFWDGREESVEPGTFYRVRVEYAGEGITGPRVPGAADYGLVAKLGGWYDDCYEPDTGTAVTSYGRNTTGFGYVEGRWYSGANNFLPLMHLGLENVKEGTVYVRSVSLRKELAGGGLGPELMITPSMERHLYIPEERAHSLDKLVENAERNGVYLKLVLMDKNDKIYFKLEDDGTWAMVSDNQDGFYGLGRAMNKTRWLQQMWWRYAQARWGYSTSIHSWELTNEGDPTLTTHYELADELGKFMHCRAFGVEPGLGDGARCSLDHPNDHLTTTSFWQWFPAPEFWRNSKYPNLDYADLHAYVSTSFAPLADRQSMQWDSAYFHTWHSDYVASQQAGKPVVRGESGLDGPDGQDIGVERDTSGVWLHNFLWSALDAGGLYEIYWYNMHIWNEEYDHRDAYRGVQAFLQDIPLNKGGYADWGGTASTPLVRVVGQKNTAKGMLHLWVQNRDYTWKNVVDRKVISPASGEVAVPGFKPSTAFVLERWDTHAPGGKVVSTEQLSTDAGGILRIPFVALGTDLAIKAKLLAVPPRAPTGVRIVK